MGSCQPNSEILKQPPSQIFSKRSRDRHPAGHSHSRECTPVSGDWILGAFGYIVIPKDLSSLETPRLTEVAITTPAAPEPKLIYSSTGSCVAEIYLGDAFKFLSGLPEASADLLFLDPPFNLGKKYSGFEIRCQQPTTSAG